MYCSVTDPKTYLGISGTGDDSLLAALIASSQKAIDRHCHRKFEAPADTTRTFDADRDVQWRTLFLDHDLCQITSITNGDDDVLTTAEYTTEPRNETPYYAITLLWSSSVTWTYTNDTEDAITIVGRWAFSLAAPDDVVQACRRLAAYLYRQKDNAQDLDRAVLVGNATILPTELPRDIKTLLAPYVRLI